MGELDDLLRRQSSIMARRQLNALGIDSDHVRAHVVARRWVVHTPRVVGTTTGVLTWVQRCWVAVLHAGPRSMVGGLTAARYLGLANWDRPSVTVLVDDELAFEPVEGVRFFRGRRPFELLRSPRPGIATAQLEPAILLWAAYDAPARAAHGVLAAAVQQRLTTAARLLTWVDTLQPLRRARAFRHTLGGIAGGAQSGSELDVHHLCRRYGLAPPEQQVARTDRAGRRRFTDCEWRLPDGRVVVLEIDGSFHGEAVEWAADIKRSRALMSHDRLVVRCTAFELRHEEGDVARDLLALGVPRRHTHPAA